MRLLVLGGTRFLSREVAAQAVARGWDVTCGCRGSPGRYPPGADFVRWDRTEGPPDALRDGAWDAVVDVARLPSHVRRAVAAVPGAHWVFVSTINVYADNSSPAMGRLVEPVVDDVDLAADPEAYGGMKVACEAPRPRGRGLLDGRASRACRRPRGLHRPLRVLARAARSRRRGAGAGDPDDVVQVIDVRDLAAWILDACAARTTGVYDGVGPPTAHRRPAGRGGGRGWVRRRRCSPGSTEPSWRSQGVQHWSGDGSVPLWLPRPDHDGMMSHDPAPAIAAGLRLRPLGDTARDSLGGTVHAISAEREAEVLAAWRSRLTADLERRPGTSVSLEPADRALPARWNVLTGHFRRGVRAGSAR